MCEVGQAQGNPLIGDRLYEVLWYHVSNRHNHQIHELLISYGEEEIWWKYYWYLIGFIDILDLLKILKMSSIAIF